MQPLASDSEHRRASEQPHRSAVLFILTWTELGGLLGVFSQTCLGLGLWSRQNTLVLFFLPFLCRASGSSRLRLERLLRCSPLGRSPVSQRCSVLSFTWTGNAFSKVSLHCVTTELPLLRHSCTNMWENRLE